jgi:hypothetical protein
VAAALLFLLKFFSNKLESPAGFPGRAFSLALKWGLVHWVFSCAFGEAGLKKKKTATPFCKIPRQRGTAKKRISGCNKDVV